jgi:hypothetical protein
MLNSIEPKFSRNQVRKAGKATRDGISNFEYILTLEKWHASHAYILNKFHHTNDFVRYISDGLDMLRTNP